MAVDELDIAGTSAIRRSASTHFEEYDREPQLLQLEGKRQPDRTRTDDADIRRFRLKIC